MKFSTYILIVEIFNSFSISDIDSSSRERISWVVRTIPCNLCLYKCTRLFCNCNSSRDCSNEFDCTGLCTRIRPICTVSLAVSAHPNRRRYRTSGSCSSPGATASVFWACSPCSRISCIYIPPIRWDPRFGYCESLLASRCLCIYNYSGGSRSSMVRLPLCNRPVYICTPPGFRACVPRLWEDALLPSEDGTDT